MRLLFIALVVVGLWLLWVLRASLREMHPRSRQLLARFSLGVLLVAVLGLVLLRFGVHWLAVAGAAAVAFLGRGWPLLMRIFTLAALWRRMRGAGFGPGTGNIPPGGFRSPGADDEAPGPRSRGMSRAEALQILGLEEGATRDEVLREYRRLMKRLHPDLGGSSYLSSKVNQAKDVLLN